MGNILKQTDLDKREAEREAERKRRKEVQADLAKQIMQVNHAERKRLHEEARGIGFAARDAQARLRNGNYGYRHGNQIMQAGSADLDNQIMQADHAERNRLREEIGFASRNVQARLRFPGG